MQSVVQLRRSATASYVAEVKQSVWLTPTIKSIQLRLDRDEFQFFPGQSVWPTFERGGKSFKKIYSIASSPSECPEIELCVSRVGWSSAYLQDLAVGQTIEVRGPYGLMTLNALPDRPRLFIAEGSGIAPLKSQIEWLWESRYPYPIALVQSNPETPEVLPYEAYWRSLAKSWPQFQYYPILSGKSHLMDVTLPHPLVDWDVEICAVGARSEQLETNVVAMGARFDQVRSESFYAF